MCVCVGGDCACACACVLCVSVCVNDESMLITGNPIKCTHFVYTHSLSKQEYVCSYAKYNKHKDNKHNPLTEQLHDSLPDRQATGAGGGGGGGI